MFRILALISLLACNLLASQVAADVIDGEDFIDPTRPFFVGDASNNESIIEQIRNVVPASYDVTFVRAGSSSPIAVINNRQVTIGDVIGGAQVLAIDRSGVTLLVNDQEQRINLYGTNIKSPASGR